MKHRLQSFQIGLVSVESSVDVRNWANIQLLTGALDRYSNEWHHCNPRSLRTSQRFAASTYLTTCAKLGPPAACPRCTSRQALTVPACHRLFVAEADRHHC